MSSKIFITGGSGFVGSNLIPDLIKAGYSVMALARSETAVQKVKSLGAQAIKDNLNHLSEATDRALAQCDLLIHSAAYMDFNYEKEKFYAINVEATKKLLQKAKANGVKQFIYISAAPVIPGSPIQNGTEANALKGLPKALYPKTKAIAEQAVLEANSARFQTLALRPPAIWGPNNHHVEEILDRVRKGQWMWIGGGHQILSTIHIANLSAAVLSAIQNGQGGQAYFVTDSDRRSMRTTFSAIIKAHGLDAGNREIPLWLANGLAQTSEMIWKLLGLKSRPPVPPLAIRLMAREFSVSDEKARRELQYRPVISFEEGIRQIQLENQ